MSMSNLQEERQDHAHHRRNEVAHRLVRAILRVTRVPVTIAGHLPRARAWAILLHRVHSNVPKLKLVPLQPVCPREITYKKVPPEKSKSMPVRH
jgi:hypothetical protein